MTRAPDSRMGGKRNNYEDGRIIGTIMRIKGGKDILKISFRKVREYGLVKKSEIIW